MSSIRRRRTACGTCVRRKVKCDETHPTCQRCQKGKFKCEGYDPEFVFVEEDPTKRYKTVPRIRSELKDSTRASTSRTSSPRTGPSSSAVSPSATRNASAAPQTGDAVAGAVVKTVDTASAHLNGVEIPYLSLATAAYLGAGRFASSTRLRPDVATSFFASLSQDVESRRPNSRRFGQTLRLLNEKLSAQPDEKSSDVFPDIAAMLFKDLILLGVNLSEWIKHVDGLARLILFHKPKAFVSQSTRNFLSSVRGIIIKKCLLEKKPCFLGDTDWREIPWNSDSREKDLFEQLHDIVTQLPGVAARVERLNRPEQDQPGEALSVKNDIQQLLISLFQWRCTWQVQNPWAVHSVPLTTSKVTPTWSPFVSVIHFDQPLNAWAITSYNATYIELCALAEVAIGKHFSIAGVISAAKAGIDQWPTNSASLLALPSADMTPQKAASEICALVDYHFEAPHRSEAVFTLVCALGTAEKSLEENDRIVGWIGEVMRKITLEDASGFALATDDFGGDHGSSGKSMSSGASDTD